MKSQPQLFIIRMDKILLLLLVLKASSLASTVENDLTPLFKKDDDGMLRAVSSQTKKPRTNSIRYNRLGEQNTEQNDSLNNTFNHPYDKPDIVADIKRTYSRYHEMILVRGGTFWQGTNFPESTTGEYPLREVAVDSFYMDKNPVINADYWAFRSKKKFVRTDAESRGWSWVVDMFLTAETRQYYSMPGPTGWAAVKRANWDAPEGPGSNLANRWSHPVVHISWYDAKTYCEYHGKRLSSESEWEYAARAGVRGRNYPWGDFWERKRANVWQGAWPYQNTKGDGFTTTAPVDAYISQNSIGFYDLIGNVWEWTMSAYVQRMSPAHLQTKMAVLKGGSFVDSVNGYINAAVRNGNRMGQSQDYSAANVGFRCAKDAPAKHKVNPEDLVIGVGRGRGRSQPMKENAQKKIMFHRKDEL